LPGRIRNALHYWIQTSDVYALAERKQIDLYDWFVCSGMTESVRRFNESIAERDTDRLQHILVRNYGLQPAEEWKAIEQDSDYQAARKETLATFDLPKLSIKEVLMLARNELAFDRASEGNNIPLMSQSRITRFLKDTFAQLDELGILKGSDQAHSNGHQEAMPVQQGVTSSDKQEKAGQSGKPSSKRGSK
jgi:hypothetical protein